jgi:predicted permease
MLKKAISEPFLWPLMIILPLIFIITYAFAPKKYSISPTHLTINRLAHNITIPLESIESIARTDKNDFGKFTIHVFGSGGFCGAYGKFYSSKVGFFTAYITNTTDLVMIEHSKGNKLLISPESPDDVLNTISVT